MQFTEVIVRNELRKQTKTKAQRLLGGKDES